MQNCKDYIVKIYTHPSICQTIAKIKPIDLQDDLKQELALCLLNYDCKKIFELQERDELIKFSMKILMSMATGTNNSFFRAYKKNDINKAIEYFRSQIQLPTIPISLAVSAKKILDNKEQLDIYQAHESKIFNKYIELQSIRKVAAYYSVPPKHIQDVVAKVRAELKEKLKQ